jgi:DNA polymerase-3 subunit gamma/tau
MKITFTKKYRPSKFADLISQDEIKKILQNILKNQISVSSFLLYGDRGCGKTSMARIFASALNCQKLSQNDFEPCGLCAPCKSIQAQTNLDIIEIDAASNNSVENIRLLIENSKYLPQNSKKKIYILDEAHMLSLSAFNALLKILEEPPEYVIFILITTEYRKIPLTVISRCLRLQFKKIDHEKISEFLEKICNFEGINFEKIALQTIADLAEGAVRDSLSLLESVSILTEKQIKNEFLTEIFGILSEKKDLFEIFQNILLNQTQNTFSKIQELLRNGIDVNFFIQSLITLVSEIIFLKKMHDFEDFEEFKKIDFSNFQILSFISIEKIFHFFVDFSKNLDFKDLFEILEILNQSVKLFSQNIYQNQENFLKITVVKLSLNFGLKEEKNKNSLKKEISIEDQNPKITFQNKTLDEPEKDLKNNEQDSNNLNNSSENLKNNLLKILKKNHEFLISDLVNSEKIKINFEKSFILDDGSAPSRHLIYILKILRSNFDSKWRIVLKENLNEESRQIKTNDENQNKDSEKKIDQINSINKIKSANKKNEIKSPEEIKKEFTQSKFFEEMKRIFKVSENNIKITK